MRYISSQQVRVFKGHKVPIWSMSFSLEENMLASGGDDQPIHLWDMNTDLLIKDFQRHIAPIYGVCFSLDERILASASNDQTVQL